MGCGTSKEAPPNTAPVKPAPSEPSQGANSAPVSEAINGFKGQAPAPADDAVAPRSISAPATGVSGKQTATKVAQIVDNDGDVFHDDPDVAEVDRLLKLDTLSRSLDIHNGPAAPEKPNPHNPMRTSVKLVEDLEAEDLENNAAKWLQKPSKLPSIPKSAHQSHSGAADLKQTPQYESPLYGNSGTQQQNVYQSPELTPNDARELSYQKAGFTDISQSGVTPPQQSSVVADQDLQMMEQMLDKNDPWASLQSQYRINQRPSSSGQDGRASPSGRRPVAAPLAPSTEMMVLDDDEDGPRVYHPQPTLNSTGTRRRGQALPPKAPPPAAGGAARQGGWGQGRLAAAGTLMVGDDDLAGSNDHHSQRPYAPRAPSFGDDDDLSGFAPPPNNRNAAPSKQQPASKRATDLGVEEVDEVEAYQAPSGSGVGSSRYTSKPSGGTDDDDYGYNTRGARRR